MRFELMTSAPGVSLHYLPDVPTVSCFDCGPNKIKVKKKQASKLITFILSVGIFMTRTQWSQFSAKNEIQFGHKGIH